MSPHLLAALSVEEDYEIESTLHYRPLVEAISSNISQHCQFKVVHLGVNSSCQMVNLYD